MKKGIPTTYFIILILIVIGIVVLITTDVPSKILKLRSDVNNVELQDNEAMFIDGNSFVHRMKYLAGDEGASSTSHTSITKIERSKTILNQNKTEYNKVSSESSPKQIYIWFDNGIIYYYTDASKIYLNPDSRQMFLDLYELESIDFEFDTSKVTTMQSMFEDCEKLTSIDLSKFDTSNVTNMESMFNGCRSLTSLNLSSFNTSNVTDMSDMFQSCTKLMTLNLSGFNTSNVTNMESMFYGLLLIKNLDLSSFDTKKVTNMKEMFGECRALISINLSTFDTSNVTNMWAMFRYCNDLKSLDLRTWNTSKVTDMSDMFSECYDLESIIFGNSFDTSNVTDMSSMFFRSGIVNLDLSSFDTSNVTKMISMFSYCKSLKKIYVSSKFNVVKVTDSDYMFHDCESLVGENGTTYNENKVDKTYARVDITNTPGYFTGVYKIVYHGNGGLYNGDSTYPDSRNYVYNVVFPGATSDKELIYSNFFTRNGYTFTGWKTKAGYTGWSAGYKGDSDKLWKWHNGEYGIGEETQLQLDLYAQWTPAPYKIKYHGNGGVWKNTETEWLDPRNFVYNEVYPNSDTLPIISTNDNFFKRDGYVFAGWKTKAGYTGWTPGYSGNNTKKWQWYDGFMEGNISVGVGDEVPHQLDLYAVWEPIIYKVNYHGNGGLYLNEEEYLDKREFKYGVTFPGATSGKKMIYTNDGFFVREGYVFKGWTTKAGYTGWGQGGYIGNKIWKFLDGQYGVGDEVPHQLDLYAMWEEEKQEIDISSLDIRDNQVAVFNGEDSLSSIKSKLSNNNVILKDKNGNTKENGNLATNDKLVIEGNTYDISVQGDVSGDGEYTTVDVVLAYRIYKNTAQNLTDAQVLAAKVFGTDKVTIRDITKIYRIVKGNN